MVRWWSIAATTPRALRASGWPSMPPNNEQVRINKSFLILCSISSICKVKLIIIGKDKQIIKQMSNKH